MTDPQIPAFLLRNQKGQNMTAPTPAPAVTRAPRKPRQDVYRVTITVTIPVDMKKAETVRAALDAGAKLENLDLPMPEGSLVHVAGRFEKLSAE